MRPGSMDRRGASKAFAAAAMAVLLTGAAPAEERFETRLAPVAMDLLTRDSVAGVGRATAVLTGAQLSLTATFQGLPSAATTANLHQGVAVGARGPVAFKLAVTGTQAGTLTGRLKLSRPQLAALRQGRMYVQIQSQGAPDGHLWGWLLPAKTPPSR